MSIGFYTITEIFFCASILYAILSNLSIVYAMNPAYPHIHFYNGFFLFMGQRLHHKFRLWRFVFQNNKFENLLIFFLTYICRSGKLIFAESTRRDVRVVEGARLESVYTGNCIWGSNPHLSATSCVTKVTQFFCFFFVFIYLHISKEYTRFPGVYTLFVLFQISITSPVKRVSMLAIYCFAIW